VEEVTGREEMLRKGIHARNALGTGFTPYDVAYLLELKEIVFISKDDTEMVGISRDASMGIVDGGYTIACLVFPFAFDTLWSPVIITLLLEAGRRMQVEYNN
jgi:hypothetical protein